jgi:hypothetical protein
MADIAANGRLAFRGTRAEGFSGSRRKLRWNHGC